MKSTYVPPRRDVQGDLLCAQESDDGEQGGKPLEMNSLRMYHVIEFDSRSLNTQHKIMAEKGFCVRYIHVSPPLGIFQLASLVYML